MTNIFGRCQNVFFYQVANAKCDKRKIEILPNLSKNNLKYAIQTFMLFPYIFMLLAKGRAMA